MVISKYKRAGDTAQPVVEGLLLGHARLFLSIGRKSLCCTEKIEGVKSGRGEPAAGRAQAREDRVFYSGSLERVLLSSPELVLHSLW